MRAREFRCTHIDTSPFGLQRGHVSPKAPTSNFELHGGCGGRAELENTCGKDTRRRRIALAERFTIKEKKSAVSTVLGGREGGVNY